MCYDTTKSDTSIYYKQNESVKDLGVFTYKENVSPEFTNNGVANKGDVGDVVLNRLTQSLDKSSLYNVNPNAPKGYVIETDPRFANKQKWLSSDYMFNALRYDPNNMLKRLGDGFYELRLVNEQINQLTGRRYLDGYQNALEQYKGLMNNGIRYAKQFNLVPGVGLTKEQMAELTTDLVWMVNQEITLPSGKKLNVLTPKIYLATNRTKITPTGSVISGDSIVGTVKDMTNEGTVLAANLVNLYGQDLENKGLVFANNVNLNAKQKLVNIGGKIVATDSVSLYGGKSVELGATTTETQSQLGRTETGNKLVDRQSEVTVTGKGGEITIKSGGDITLKAANVKSTGKVDVNAKGKLLVTTEKQSSKEHYDFSDNHHYHLDQENEVGSVIEGKDGVRLIGQEKTTLRQAKVSSEDGKVMVDSKGDVLIEEGRNIEHLDTRNKQKSKGAFTSVTEEYKHKHNYDLSKDSEIDGKSVVIYSQDGNVTVQGSSVVGDDSLTVKAKNIDIREAENRVYSDDYYSKKKSGMLGGGIGVTFGSQKQTTESDQTKLYAQGSQVGSLSGSTTMIAENTYTQTASKVSAIKDGDVNILAKKVDIKAADDKYETNTKQTFEQKGLTTAITSPVISAIQAVQGAVQSTRQVGESKHGRVNAMAAANAGFDAYRAADSVMNAGDSIQKAMSNSDVDSVVGVQITYGQQKSESRTHTEGKAAAKSQVNAGGKVNIVATGAGKDSNINIKGSDISGKQGTTLMADNQVNIKATEQNHQERSTNKSSGFNAGVAIKVGSGVAAGITVGGNYGKGYGNGDETSYVASHVGDSQSKTVINAGGDANLIGSQVKGKRVEVNAQNLNIESLQDTATYKGKQMNVSGSVTAGYGVSAGGSYNKSKVNADHASVNEQAGIYAGDEGYDINVNKHTDLKGALITSTQKAEADGKNHFSTGSLTHSDIENHSNYSGSSFGVSGSVAANFDTPFGKEGQAQSGKQAVDDDGNLIYRNDRGELTTEAKNAQGKDNAKQLATGWDSLETTHSVGFGYDKDSQSSTTKSGINTKNIEIRNTSTQESLTGKTVNETISAIKTDITLDSAQSQSGKLENHFNKDEVQREIDLQRNVTQEFDRTRQGIKDELLKIADAKRAEAVEIRRNNRGEDGKTGYNTDESLKLEEQADTWERASLATDLVLGGVYGWGNSTALKYTGSAAVGTPMARTAFSPEQIWLEKCKQDSLYCADHNMDGALRPKENDKKAQIGYKRQIFDISELKPSDLNNVITISNNGIFNPFDDALKNAIKQNKWNTNKEGVVVVYNRPTGNIISEMLYAAYDKTNDLLGGRLPLTTAEKANVKLYNYAKQNGYQIDLSNHSRGGLTASVALQYANRNGLTNIPIRESRFFGTATNVQSYKNNLVENNGGYIYKDKNGIWQSSDGTEVKSAVHKSDFVGNKWNLGLTGFNDTTGGACLLCYSHSSYYAEIPLEHLINENGDFIDNKGNVVKTQVLNKYSDDFIKIWAPKDKNTNSSLPKIIKDSGDK